MSESRRIRPSPAAVIGSLAILVSLTGTGIAAVSQVPARSVGTAQLQANAVTSPKVANAALALADFKPGQLVARPEGPPGPAGPAGPKGDTGEKGQPGRLSATFVVRGDTVVVPGGIPENGYYESETLQVTCAPGEKALSAGTEWRDLGVEPEAWTGYLRPLADSSGAVIGYRAAGGNDSGLAMTFVLWVFCYSV